jgi:hypothetical protein
LTRESDDDKMLILQLFGVPVGKMVSRGKRRPEGNEVRRDQQFFIFRHLCLENKIRAVK